MAQGEVMWLATISSCRDAAAAENCRSNAFVCKVPLSLSLLRHFDSRSFLPTSAMIPGKGGARHL